MSRTTRFTHNRRMSNRPAWQLALIVAIVAVLAVFFIAAGISIYIIGWTLVVWTFQVNNLWGVAALIAWLFINKFLLSAKK